MMDNIVPLSNALLVHGEPNARLVATLEELLDQARSGYICGAAIATLSPDDGCCYHLTGRVGGYALVGALDCLRQHLTMQNMGLDDGA